jgi:fatty-acid desaturase
MYVTLLAFYVEYYWKNGFYILVSGVAVKVLSSYYNVFIINGLGEGIGVKKLEDLPSEYFDKFSAIGEEYHKYHIDSKYSYTKERISKAAYALHIITKGVIS